MTFDFGKKGKIYRTILCYIKGLPIFIGYLPEIVSILLNVFSMMLLLESDAILTLEEKVGDSKNAITPNLILLKITWR